MSKKTISIILALAIMAVIAFVVLKFKNKQGDNNYQTTNVAIGNVRKTINVDADITPKIYANISSELPAIIESVNVSVNDKVKKGDILFTLNRDSLNAQVKNAELAVERAELAEKKSRRKWDSLKPEERDSIKKATQQAREQLKEIIAQAEKAVIVSPIDGVVIKQDARVGDVAKGVLIKIINPDSLYLEGFIPEVDIAKVKKGSECSITFDAYPNKVLKGTLESFDISNTDKENITYYKAVINFSNKENLKILNGMNASVDIETNKKNNVLIVPRDFAQKDDHGYFVYVKKNSENNNDEVVKKYFKVGIIGNKNIEVLSDLKKGEEIIKKTN